MKLLSVLLALAATAVALPAADAASDEVDAAAKVNPAKPFYISVRGPGIADGSSIGTFGPVEHYGGVVFLSGPYGPESRVAWTLPKKYGTLVTDVYVYQTGAETTYYATPNGPGEYSTALTSPPAFADKGIGRRNQIFGQNASTGAFDADAWALCDFPNNNRYLTWAPSTAVSCVRVELFAVQL